ncbi:MAG: hypothetical protein RR435_02865 [Erysipelotrichaceae bacterium]
MREAAFRDDLKPVVERLSIITLDGNKIKNTDRTITESGPQWTSSHSGTSMDQHTSAVQLEYSTTMKEEVCFSDLEKDVKFEDLELAFKQMKEEREIALGRAVTIQEEFNLRDKYYKQRSITSFEHSMDSDLEGISQFLDYCPIIGGVKQTLEGIIGTTLSGELINDLEAKNMVVMGIFSTGIDLIPLGSILKSCNTVKSLVVSATKDIVTSEAIGYTNSFMASCGAPPSSLIIMNLLATSVFTHYNKVSSIKELDGMPPKVNGTNINYIDDTFSVKKKLIIGNKYDVDPIEKVGNTEIDIKPNNDKQNVDFKDGIQANKGTSGAKSGLKTVDTGDLKVVETKTPEVANNEWLSSGYDNPPYNTNFEVKVVKAGNEEYVRAFSYNADGTSNKLGGWLMKKSDIESLAPAQIADKYALPKEPTHICDVKVNPDFNLQTGIANSVEGWGNGGSQQFDTMGKFINEDAFINERLIGE